MDTDSRISCGNNVTTITLVSSSSPDDSGLDMAGEDVRDTTEDCDETDSYITMSDTSSTSTESETVKNDCDVEVDEKESCPIFKDFYQNCEDSQDDGDVGPHISSDIVVPKTIGYPEMNEAKSRKNILQKSVRLFSRRSKDQKSLMVKSKSEGNIKELIDKEPRQSLLQSLYRGFSSMSFRCPEQKTDDITYHQENTGYLSLGAELFSLNENQMTVQKLKSREAQMQSLPFMAQPPEEGQTSIFSCFTNVGTKPLMPNHRSVMRPRDIKVGIILYRLQTRIEYFSSSQRKLNVVN